jgi:hypothetical protein
VVCRRRRDRRVTLSVCGHPMFPRLSGYLFCSTIACLHLSKEVETDYCWICQQWSYASSAVLCVAKSHRTQSTSLIGINFNFGAREGLSLGNCWDGRVQHLTCDEVGVWPVADGDRRRWRSSQMEIYRLGTPTQRSSLAGVAEDLYATKTVSTPKASQISRVLPRRTNGP